MNDDLKELRQLEAATAAGRDVPGEPDAETAALREGWLAFAKLVEDAGLRVDPAPLRWRPESRRPARWAHRVVALVVAAALIFVAALATGYRFWGQDGAPTSPTNQFVENRAAPRPEAKTPATLAVNDTTRWDDALDEQITATSEAVARADDDLFAQASAIESTLERMRSDLDGSQL